MEKKKHVLKRVLACVMVIMMTLTAVPMSGFVGLELPRLFETTASAATEGNYVYIVEDGEATITYCDTSVSGELVIPDTLGGYPVTSIGGYAFSHCTGLTSVTIPDSITSIGHEAFRDCTGLASIKIPDNVSSIGCDVFSHTAWYQAQPDGDVYAGKVYYEYKGTMLENTSVVIKDGTKGIAGYAFYNCDGLTSVTIPDSVTSIGNIAFGRCTGLKSVTMPNSVTSIGYYAFSDCTGLTSITIPNSVTSLGDSAFINCTGLTSVTIGNSVTSIGSYSFSGCTGLTSITIPDSVISIGGNAFTDTAWYKAQPFGDVYAGKVYYKYKGTMLENTSVVIKDGTKGIAGSAFSDCDGLTSITIPDSVKSIGDMAFSDCTGLTSVTIPDSVTSISDAAFSGCRGLTKLTIPGSVTSIGESAFSQCTGLTSVMIPNSVTSIDNSAFNSCGLISVTIGNGVETISSGAFKGCPLTTIKIGKNVKKIGKNAFKGIESIPEVYYAGSEADWKNISIDQSNDMILRANMHYNVDITHTHSYTSKVTKKATCTESGVKTFNCDCGKTYTETIPATGHKYKTETHAATCTSIGVSIKKCTVCGTVASASTTPAKGHSFVSEITAATCTSIGYETKTCKTCGECHFVRKIPATGHTLKTDVEPATFTESGLSITSCKTCGTITKATLIKRIASVTLSATKYTYNGKVQTPTVTVKDSAGKVLKKNTDYTVSYASGRKNPGKYTVKVTFKGNYSGEKMLYFTIAPATPTLAVTAGAKKATLKWNKQTGATGYVVYMATSKTGKYTKIATIKNNGTVSMTKTGLTTGKTYYFKVAAYTTSGGSTVYGSYSSVKSVKIK